MSIPRGWPSLANVVTRSPDDPQERLLSESATSSEPSEVTAIPCELLRVVPGATWLRRAGLPAAESVQRVRRGVDHVAARRDGDRADLERRRDRGDGHRRPARVDSPQLATVGHEDASRRRPCDAPRLHERGDPGDPPGRGATRITRREPNSTTRSDPSGATSMPSGWSSASGTARGAALLAAAEVAPSSTAAHAAPSRIISASAQGLVP